jgi:hypothetical protein
LEYDKRQTYRRALALALEASTKVIHNNIRAPTAKEDSVLAPKSTARARHNDRLAIVPQFLGRHDVLRKGWC